MDRRNFLRTGGMAVLGSPPNAPRTDPGIASEGIASEPRTVRWKMAMQAGLIARDSNL